MLQPAHQPLGAVLLSVCDTFYMYRVLIAEGEGALYVAFMGTKQRRDLLTNANAMQTPLWLTAEVDGDRVSPPFSVSYK